MLLEGDGEGGFSLGETLAGGFTWLKEACFPLALGGVCVGIFNEERHRGERRG